MAADTSQDKMSRSVLSMFWTCSLNSTATLCEKEVPVIVLKVLLYFKSLFVKKTVLADNIEYYEIKGQLNVPNECIFKFYLMTHLSTFNIQLKHFSPFKKVQFVVM